MFPSEARAKAVALDDEQNVAATNGGGNGNDSDNGNVLIASFTRRLRSNDTKYVFDDVTKDDSITNAFFARRHDIDIDSDVFVFAPGSEVGSDRPYAFMPDTVDFGLVAKSGKENANAKTEKKKEAGKSTPPPSKNALPTATTPTPTPRREREIPKSKEPRDNSKGYHAKKASKSKTTSGGKVTPQQRISPKDKPRKRGTDPKKKTNGTEFLAQSSVIPVIIKRQDR